MSVRTDTQSTAKAARVRWIEAAAIFRPRVRTRLQCVSVLTAYFMLLCEIAHTHAEFNRPTAARASAAGLVRSRMPIPALTWCEDSSASIKASLVRVIVDHVPDRVPDRDAHDPHDEGSKEQEREHLHGTKLTPARAGSSR